MLNVDIPYIKYAPTPALTEQATSPHKYVGHVRYAYSNAKHVQTDQVLPSFCLDVGTSGVYNKGFNAYSPLGVALEHLGYHWDNKTGNFNVPATIARGIKASVFKEPENGNIIPTSGKYVWDYVAYAGFEGKDQVTYLVEIQGKRFKVIVNILVHEVIPDPNDPPACEIVYGNPKIKGESAR